MTWSIQRKPQSGQIASWVKFTKQLVLIAHGGSPVLSEYRNQMPSKYLQLLKGSFRLIGLNTNDGGIRSILKLELTQAATNRYYSTTLSSRKGTRKERKDSKAPTAEKMRCSLSNDNLTQVSPSPSQVPQFHFIAKAMKWNCMGGGGENSMKGRASPKSPTAYRNANCGAGNGPQGVIDSLRTLEKTDGKFRKLIHISSDIDMLIYAYELIRNKAGNMTPAVDMETLDGIDRKWFEDTSLALRQGTFKFRDGRRVEIPKPKGGTRPLTVGNPRDKIVQKAVELVLNHIYEDKLKRFSDNVHGFRPNRSCHTALKQIKNTWTATPWYLEFDLKKAFDTVNRKRLISILEEDICDHALMALLNKMLNAGVIKARELVDLSEGVPQGNILSPLLSNIYFAKLDDFVEGLITKHNRGVKPTRHMKYLKAITPTEEEVKGKNTLQINQLKKRKTLLAWKSGLRPTIFDDKFIRIKYVRYADDFIVGVRGSKSLAIEIRREITNFLREDLHLSVNEEKTNLTHVYSDKARYLGMTIHCVPSNKIPFRRAAHIERFRRLKARILAKIERAEVKQQKVLKKSLINAIRKNLKETDPDPNNVSQKANTPAKQTASVLEIISRLQPKDTSKDTNDRQIIRTLAAELSLLPRNEEYPELNKMLDDLKRWQPKLDDTNRPEHSPEPKNTTKLTMKDIGERIYRRWGEVLELKAPPKRGFEIPRNRTKEIYDKKNNPISRFPDDFELTPTQIDQIRRENQQSRGASTFRYLACVKIIIDKQKDWEGLKETRSINTRTITAKVRLETTGMSKSISPQINADIIKILNKLKAAGIVDENARYKARYQITSAEDADIVRYYSSIAHGMLSFYRCADNLGKVKSIIANQIRLSLAATLRQKHKMSVLECQLKYGNPITCEDYQKKKVSFLTNMQIYNLKKEFLVSVNPRPFDNINRVYLRLSNSLINQGECAVKGCRNTDIEIHHLRKLIKRTEEGEGFTVITAGKAKRITGVLALQSALKRKQIPLCREHHREWHNRKIGISELQEQYTRK